MAGPLKLATKYQADILCNRIIAHLETDWPTTLEAWDSIAYDDPDASDGASSQSPETDSDTLPKQFCPDPVPFISLARENNLPAVLAIVFYSLCRNSTSRTEELSCMTRGDVESLMLGRERMMSFIGGPGADQLDINSWVPLEDYYDHSSYPSVNCTDKSCRYPVVVTWLGIVQDVMRSGDPLATIRASARKLDKEAEKALKEEEHRFYNRDDDHRNEMCLWCKSRLSDGLFDLRQTLFDQLPFFFPLSHDDN